MIKLLTIIFIQVFCSILFSSEDFTNKSVNLDRSGQVINYTPSVLAPFWTVKTDMPIAKSGAAVGYYYPDSTNTYIHVFGGDPAPKKEHMIYNYYCGAWSISSVSLSYEYSYGGYASYNDKIYIFGGWGPLNTTTIYDCAGDSYITGANMPVPMNDCPAAVVGDRGLIYLVGGGNGLTAQTDVQVYDVTGDSWFVASSLPSAVMSSGAGYIGNDTLLVAVGRDSGGNILNSTYYGVIDMSDPSLISWIAGPSFTGIGVYRPGYAVYNNDLYIFGGSTGISNKSATYRYRSGESWIQLADKPTALMGIGACGAPTTDPHSAYVIGYVFSCGGYSPHSASFEMLYTEVIHIREFFWDFETGTQNWTHANGQPFPAGWSVISSTYQVGSWSVAPPNAGDSCFCIDSDAYGGSVLDTAFSPPFEPEGDWLYWGIHFQDYAGRDTVEVLVREYVWGSGWGPWNMVFQYTVDTDPTTDSADISGFSDILRIAFVYNATNWDWFAAFDNVRPYDSYNAVTETPVDIMEIFTYRVLSANPVFNNVAIEFNLPIRGSVKFKVYDVTGRIVFEQDQGILNSGIHRLMWSLNDIRNYRVASGTYFFSLDAAGNLATGKFIVIE